jgi:DNA (cytosine-5)-methyltransferase 1
MVNPGDDEDMIRARNAESDASQSVNTYANRLWYVVFFALPFNFIL